jgi:drug/metabolite transporter (DMT)-like permease
VLWGLNWPAMKLGLGEVGPWTFRTVCLLGGGLGLLGLARAAGLALRVPRAERAPLALITLLNISLWHLLSAYGLTLIQAGRAAILGYTMPLWAALLGGPVLGERLGPRRGAGLGLGLLGMGLLLAPDLGRVRAAPLGALFMLGAAASWAAGTVVMKRYRWSLPTLVLTAWQVFLGGLPLLAGALVLESPAALARVGAAGWAGTAYATLVGVVVCHSLWFRMVRALPAGVATVGSLGVPVVGVFGSAALLGERPGPAEILALALVVAALGLVLLGPAARAGAGPSRG